jgi:hypothetical protein
MFKNKQFIHNKYHFDIRGFQINILLMTLSLCYLYNYAFYVFYLQALPDEHASALNPRHLAGAGGDLVPTYPSRKNMY